MNDTKLQDQNKTGAKPIQYITKNQNIPENVEKLNDNDKTIDKNIKTGSKQQNKKQFNYISQGKISLLKDSNNSKLNNGNYQSLVGQPKLKNPKRTSNKPYDPVASLPRVPDAQLKEMEHFYVVIEEIREYLDVKNNKQSASIPDLIRENEIVRDKIKVQNLKLNRLIEKKTIENLPVHRNSYRFFRQRNEDDLSKVYQSHLDQSDKDLNYLKLQEEILDKQLNKIGDAEYGKRLDDQLESYRNFDKVISRDIMVANRESEEMTKFLTNPKVLFEKKQNYDQAIMKIMECGKRNKSLERKLNKVMEDIGTAQVDEERLQFDKKDVLIKYNDEVKYEELKKHHDYLKAQKEILEKDVEKYKSRVTRNKKLIENDKTNLDKENDQKAKDVQDIDNAYNVLKEEVVTEYEKLKNKRTEQIEKGFAMVLPHQLLESEQDDKKANDQHMAEITELGNRLHSIQPPKDEVSDIQPEKIDSQRNRHRSNSRSMEKSQDIGVNTWKDDIHTFKKTSRQSSPKYEKYLRTRERDYNDNLMSKPKRSVFEDSGNNSSYLQSYEFDGLLQQKPVNSDEHQQFLTDSIDRVKTESVNEGQGLGNSKYEEEILEDIVGEGDLNELKKKGLSDQPLVK